MLPALPPCRIVLLCVERPSLLRQFEGQHLANLLWGLTRCGFRPLPAFLDLLAQVGACCWHCAVGVTFQLAAGGVLGPLALSCHHQPPAAQLPKPSFVPPSASGTGGRAAGARLQAAGADEHGLGLHTGVSRLHWRGFR